MTPIRRQKFNEIYEQACRQAFESQCRRAGWKRTGIYAYKPERVLECEQVLNITEYLPHITPPLLSEGVYTTPTNKEQVNEAVRQIEEVNSPTTARHSQKLGNAAISAIATISLLMESLGDIRKRKVDEEIVKRGKQMKKDDDNPVWSFEQVKAAREGLTPPPLGTTTRQRGRSTAQVKGTTTEPLHQEVA